MKIQALSGLVSGLLLCGVALAAETSERGEPVQVDVPAQPMIDALNLLATQAGLRIVFYTEVTQGVAAPRVVGMYKPEEALQALLKDSELEYRFKDGRTVEIRAVKETQPVKVSDAEVSRAGSEASSPNEENPATNTDAELQEVLVTGTHIPGARTTSRVSSYTREDIERQGFGSIKDFIQSLPENFNGGASENAFQAFVPGDGNAGNAVNGTGINLRGLGNDATLVLLNGHRISAGNNQGNFVDVSMIPLSAIERVDVMPDGASAIYGSDAVGGVVNFILRRNVGGEETRLRTGTVTEGNRRELQASQSFGRDWASGSALLVYDYSDTTALAGHDRDYAADRVSDPFTLLPEQTRHSVLLTARQETGSRVEIFGDGLFSHREGRSLASNFTSPPFVYSSQYDQNIEEYVATLGARVDVAERTTFELEASYSKSASDNPTTDLINLGVTSNIFDTTVSSVDARFSGSLFDISAGSVLFAVGGQYRKETYSYNFSDSDSTDFANSRHIGAGFAELHVPLLGSRQSAAPRSTLELEAAVRHERYSDFGTATNPKVGLIWRPASVASLHMSYGTSFVAPLLSNLNPIPAQVVAVPGSLASLISGSPDLPDSMAISGGNPDLTAQKSRSWTAGADFQAHPLGFRAHLNYFRTVFDDRITNAQALIPSIFHAFNYDALLGPRIIQRNPLQSDILALSLSPNFQNFGVADLTTITAIIDARQLNLSAVKTSGIDFGASMQRELAFGRYELGLDGTYMLEFDNRFTASAPVISFLNTAYNPIDIKLRARNSLRRGPLTISLFLNYVDSYRNETIPDQSPAKVSSWTTLDAVVGCESNRPAGVLSGLNVTLGVTNLANRAPPYVQNAGGTPEFGLNFDAANANALGRFVYAQLAKKW